MYSIFPRVLTGLLFLIPCTVLTVHSASPAADSLLAALPGARTAAERQQIYVRLADLGGDSIELVVPYWEAALIEAREAGDDYGCREALDRLVQKLTDKHPERALGFIQLADSLLPEPRFALFRSSLYAYHVWKQIAGNNSFETLGEELAKLRAKKGNLSEEEQIEWEFLTGLSIDYTSIATEAYDNIKLAIPYVERTLEKLGKYPLAERLHFEKLCHNELSDLYMYIDDKRAATEIEKCIELHDRWLKMDRRFARPDRDTTNYFMRSYSKMVFLRDLISKEQATDYYEKCMQLALERNDRKEIYSTSARYYQYMGDYPKAIAYVDSTLTHYQEAGIKADLAPIYATQSRLYEKIGDYENALKAVRKANNLRYDNRVQQAQSNLAEMQTLFNVNSLELEKAQLADRNKFFMLVTGGILLLLLAGWSVYQYFMVRRLKQARAQLLAANEEVSRQSRRALESEKMKTAFINSICHEIRTPLNAINGFSELLLDEDHDNRTRHEFRTEIRENTIALTTQLENMLELAKLISSEEPLPLAGTDVGLLCAGRLELQKQLNTNPAVEYVLESGGGELRDSDQRLLPDARHRQPAAERRQIHRRGEHHPRLPQRRGAPHAAYQRQRHGHRHPARKAGVGLRTLHQGRSLQTRNGHRALPLPAGNHPPGRRHPRLPRVRGRLLHPHQPALLTPGTSLFAPFRRFFRSGRARWIVFPAEIAIFAP